MACPMGRVAHNVCTDTEWLFAENVLVFLDSTEGLVCVGSGDGGDNDCLQTSMLQKLIVVGVYGCTMRLELLVAPFCFAFIESPSGDNICAKCSLQKVCGMSTTHAA